MSRQICLWSFALLFGGWGFGGRGFGFWTRDEFWEQIVVDAALFVTYVITPCYIHVHCTCMIGDTMLAHVLL